MMRLAANLSLLFAELPLPERIAAAASAGFEGVEFQFPYELAAEVLADELARSGQPLVLINLPAGDLMSGGAGLAAVPARREAFRQALAQALDYARVVRPLAVNVLPGRLAEGVDREAALATLVVNLRLACDAFAPLGVLVMSEAINPLDMPGFLINTPAHLLCLLETVDRPNFAAQLDLYHMARQGIDPVTAIETLAGRIGHVQFADCPGRGEPGSGTLDFSAARAALGRCGYLGWLGAEYRPTGETSASLGWLNDWRN
jgi:hydroxypyruvate isomerase